MRIALGLLAAVLAAATVWLYLSAPADDLRTADGGQVTSAPYRAAALSAAAANATTVLSYSYRTLAADEEAAHAVMAPSFVQEYDDVMKVAAPKASSARLTLQATVASTSLVSLTKSTAVALLFVDAVTSAEGSAQQQLNQNRVLVTMSRQDGDWIVSKIRAF